MKNILVPTDFSPCADHASKMAIHLAKKVGHEIHFLHLMPVPVDWMSLSDTASKLYIDIDKKIKTANIELDELVTLAAKEGVEAKKFLVFEDSYEAIVRHVSQHGSTCIVMGSHGASGIKELFIGSNAQRIVRLSPVPVITVKDHYPDYQLRHVVFASEFDDSTLQQFQNLVHFIRLFDGKISLVHLNTPYDFTETQAIRPKMNQYASVGGATVVSSDVFCANDFEDGLKQYCYEKNADLLSMLTYGRQGIARAISPSRVEDMINHIDLPMLTLKAPEN